MNKLNNSTTAEVRESLNDAKTSQVLLDALFVDLDGTLVTSDLAFECIANLFKISPGHIFALPFWLLKGRAYFKRRLADFAKVDVSLLPYHRHFVGYLKEQANAGRSLVLATAADQRLAEQVARHLDIFEEVIGCDGNVNPKGAAKLQLIRKYTGGKPFSYAGNSSADLEVWKEASQVIAVNTPSSVLKQLRETVPLERMHVYPREGSLLKSFLKAIRPRQWMKNLLIFVPLVTAHKIFQLDELSQAILATAAFSFCASSVYLINDLLDLESDRQHHTKKKRPVASGELPIGLVALLAPLMLIVSGVLAFMLSPEFVEVLAIYFVATTIYSLWLKRIEIADVLLLAGLYTIRVFAGGIATGVPVSQWLLAFSVFLFLSLATVKRYAELEFVVRSGSKRKLSGRGYSGSDMSYLGSFGSSSGYIAVLVFGLYIDSEHVTQFYRYPHRLWFACPLILYWINRVWLLAHRGEMHEDPVLFASKDKISYFIVGMLALVMVISS